MARLAGEKAKHTAGIELAKINATGRILERNR
jgi:hypothetical protein